MIRTAGNVDRELLKLVRRVKATKGWTVEPSGGSHFRIVAPTGAILTCGGSSPFSARNLRSDLRRIGWVSR